MVNYKSLGLEFENECLRGAKLSYDYAVKVPDTRSLSGLVNKIINWIRNTHIVAKLYKMQFGYLPKENNFISIKSPYDLICCQGGKMIAIECKQTKCKSLAFANVKDHQIEELTKVSKSGGLAWFCISFNNREQTIATKVNDTFLVDIMIYNILRAKAITNNKKSIPYEDFNLYCKKLNRIKNKNKFCIEFPKI